VIPFLEKTLDPNLVRHLATIASRIRPEDPPIRLP